MIQSFAGLITFQLPTIYCLGGA